MIKGVGVGGTGLVEGEVEVCTDYKKHFKNPRAGINQRIPRKPVPLLLWVCHWLIRGRLSQKKRGGLGRVGGVCVGWKVGSQ